MIPGRIYSGWGGEDLDSMRDGQLVLMALLVPDSWNPTARIEPTIREWVRENDEKLRELQDDLRQWKERLNSAEFGQYRAMFDCIKAERGGLTFDEAIRSAIAGIDDVLARLSTIRTEQLQSLPVSQSRLLEVGRWASSTGFSKESGAFPLPLFGTVLSSTETLQARSLVLQGISKGEYTEPEMAQRAADEAEFFDRLLRDRVADSVLQEVIRRLTGIEQRGNSAEAYWEQVKRYNQKAKRDGRRTLLLVENRTVPEWVYDWTNRYRNRDTVIPSDMEVWHDSQLESESYLGNLNEVAVYVSRIPPGASVLVTAESFQSVSFTRLDNGNFVSAEAISIEDQPAIIDLKLTWWLDMVLDPYPSLKLGYGRP
jgi:hypothetical protein